MSVPYIGKPAAEARVPPEEDLAKRLVRPLMSKLLAHMGLPPVRPAPEPTEGECVPEK